MILINVAVRIRQEYSPARPKQLHRLIFLATLLVCTFCWPAARIDASVPTLRPIAKFAPTATTFSSRFAKNMQVDGNQVLVGSSRGAFLFEKNSTDGRSWSEVSFLRPTSGAYTFGAPVALKDGYAAIGNEGAFSSAQQAGLVSFFRSNSAEFPFTQRQVIWPPDSEIFDEFGSSVALGQGFAFVGAGNDNHAGKPSTGTVSLFEEVLRGSAVYQFQKKLAPASLNPGDGFGNEIALDGDFLVAGGRRAPYVFHRDAGGLNNWGEVDRLTETGTFGGPLAIDGHTIFASSTGRVVIAGSVSIFDYNPLANDWELTKQLSPPVSQIGDEFGYAVDLQGDLAVVSQRNFFRDSPGIPEAFVYGRNVGGPDNWGLMHTILPPDPNVGTYFGESVAVMGNLVLVGTLGFEDPLGSVYVYVVPEPTAGFLLMAGLVCMVLHRH